MDLAERVSTLRRVNGLSARQLAALVDVAPTTVTRIESGAVSPSFDLAQEILTVLGAPIGFTGVADMSAVAAARLALAPALDVAETAAVRAWWERWARLGLVGAAGAAVPGREPDLLFRAGRAARLTRRPSAVHFDPGPSAYEIAERLKKSGIAYALTGDTGANLYRSTAGEAWPVLYVASLAAAAGSAELRPLEPGAFGLRVTLLPFDGVCELDRVEIDGFTVAARDQVVLDAYGGIDRMAEQADILLGRRVA
ncbi:MAG TPA: helix-turn-helix transcriptional regulator [Candidatus Limnocylindrales bacterium]